MLGSSTSSLVKHNSMQLKFGFRVFTKFLISLNRNSHVEPSIMLATVHKTMLTNISRNQYFFVLFQSQYETKYSHGNQSLMNEIIQEYYKTLIYSMSNFNN